MNQRTLIFVLWTESIIFEYDAHTMKSRGSGWRQPEDYIYSNESNYASMDSLLEVEILVTKWKTV